MRKTLVSQGRSINDDPSVTSGAHAGAHEKGAPAPLLQLTIWPHRSLSPRGFRIVLLIAAFLLTLPLIALVGIQALYIIGIFMAADLLLLWGMIRLSYRSGRITETVSLWPDLLRVERTEPNGARKVWEANPHWVKVQLHNTRKMADYLVLSSSGRDIELGAFLTPSERRGLASELRQGLATAARTSTA